MKRSLILLYISSILLGCNLSTNAGGGTEKVRYANVKIDENLRVNKLLLEQTNSGPQANYINVLNTNLWYSVESSTKKELFISYIYSNMANGNKVEISSNNFDITNSMVATSFANMILSKGDQISDGAATDIKAKVDDMDDNVDILYRDALTNNFHVKKYVFAQDDVNRAVIEETGGINCPTASNPTAQCAFQAQDQTAINNSADFARDKNGNMYVAYINEYGYPMVDVYDQKRNQYAPINFKEYKDGLGSIPDASEINIQIDKQDNLPIIAVVRGGKNSHIVLYKFKPKTSVPTSGLSFNSMGNWDYYPGTTGTNLSATKVDNLSFILDHNNVPVLAFNQNDTQGGHLGVEEVLNNQVNVLSSLGNNQYVSEGVVNNVHIVENKPLNSYMVSYSDLGMNSSISPNYAPGMVMIAKYSLDNNTWNHIRQYIPETANQASSNGQNNSI